jgi:hypothetical protein
LHPPHILAQCGGSFANPANFNDNCNIHLSQTDAIFFVSPPPILRENKATAVSIAAVAEKR